MTRNRRPGNIPRAAAKPWRFAAALCGLALAGVGAICFLGNRSGSESSSHSAPAYFPPPPVAPSPFENTRPGVEYVGTQRCVECHAEQHASYLHTAHSRSMSAVDPVREPPEGVFDHAVSGRRYRAYRNDGELRHRESLLLPGGDELQLCDYPLKYLVGSGRFSRTYLLEDEGFLVESPLTWYASLAAWRMSPGYDQPVHSAFQRTVNTDCLFCHAGSADPIAANDERIQLGETAIGCERCHGPGSLHIQRHSTAGGEMGAEGDRTIVNPARLPRDLAEAVCHQCHLQGAVQVAVRGRSIRDFRPGLKWQEFALDYEHQTGESEMTVVGHVAQLRQSRCYQASESLTCITCHDPHAPPAPDQLIEFHRTVCLSCHAEPSCRVPLEERTARNANHCAGCHMPQAPTDVPHIAFTHHRIGIHESTDRTQETVDFRPLTPMLETPQLSGIDRQASLGLAYFQFYREHSNKPESPEHIARARPLIEAATREGLIDARLAAARAELASEARDAAAAQRWARQTLAAADLTAQEKEAALRILSAIALTEQRPAEAAMHLEELTSLRRDPQHWFLLGLARQRLQDLPGAAAAFERVLEIDPAEPETYLALAPIYGALGEPAREAQCRERARQIREAASANSEEGKEK